MQPLFVVWYRSFKMISICIHLWVWTKENVLFSMCVHERNLRRLCWTTVERGCALLCGSEVEFREFTEEINYIVPCYWFRFDTRSCTSNDLYMCLCSGSDQFIFVLNSLLWEVIKTLQMLCALCLLCASHINYPGFRLLGRNRGWVNTHSFCILMVCKR